MASSKNSGRPPKYSRAAKLREKTQAYFDDCDERRSMPNKAGLCLWLGISRDTYNEYRKRFPDTIKAIDHRIEDAWVQRLSGTAPTGAIFYLKNAFKDDYKDRQEVEVTEVKKLIELDDVQS